MLIIEQINNETRQKTSVSGNLIYWRYANSEDPEPLQ